MTVVEFFNNFHESITMIILFIIGIISSYFIMKKMMYKEHGLKYRAENLTQIINLTIEHDTIMNCYSNPKYKKYKKKLDEQIFQNQLLLTTEIEKAQIIGSQKFKNWYYINIARISSPEIEVYIPPEVMNEFKLLIQEELSLLS